MAEYKLGKICPIFLGTWVSGDSYDRLDVVLYNNVSYVSKVDNNTTTPTSSSWLMVARGATVQEVLDALSAESVVSGIYIDERTDRDLTIALESTADPDPGITIPEATFALAGLMTADDKKDINTIYNGLDSLTTEGSTVNASNVLFTVEGLIKPTGIFDTGYKNWYHTDFIDITPYSRITGKYLMSNANVGCACVLYKADKTTVVKIFSGVSNVDFYPASYSTAKYVVFQSYSNTHSDWSKVGYSLIKSKGRIATLESLMLTKANLSSLTEVSNTLNSIKDKVSIDAHNFVNKKPYLIDFNTYLNNPEMVRLEQTTFTASKGYVDNQYLGDVLMIKSNQTQTINPKWAIPFKYSDSLYMSYWHGYLNDSNNTIAVPNIIGFLTAQMANKTDGVESIMIVFSNPTKTVVKNAIDTNGYYDLTYTLKQLYITDFNSTTAFDEFSAKIDGYVEVNNVIYWHVSIKLLGFYEIGYLGFGEYTITRTWQSNETLCIGNLITSSEPFKMDASELINLDTYDIPVKIEKFNSLAYSEGYDKDNEIIDIFNGSDQFRMNTDSFGGFIHGLITHWHYIDCTFQYLKVSKTFTNSHNGLEMTFEGYKMYNEGSTLPMFVSSTNRPSILYIKPQNYTTGKHYTFLCWFDVDELKGNSISRIIQYNYCKFNINKAVAGLVVNATNTSDYKWTNYPIQFEVIDRINNLVCIRFYNVEDSNYSNYLNLCIVNISGEPVPYITIYNPTMLEGTEQIDPYHRYLSYAEKHHPDWIGKKVILMGDSQYNNHAFTTELLKKTGVKLYDCHYGGHSLAYNSSTTVNTTSKSWFYQWNYRLLVLSLTNVDAYILTFSTNDRGTPKGTLTQTAIDSVESSYPCIDDSSSDITTKLSTYNALSETQKKTIFTFLPCYASYVRLMQYKNPYAKFYMCSVPISCTGLLTGTAVPDPTSVSESIGEWASGQSPETARTSCEPSFLELRTCIESVSDWTTAKFIDWKRSSGINYNNFIYHCTDGTHWHKDIGINCANDLINQM